MTGFNGTVGVYSTRECYRVDMEREGEGDRVREGGREIERETRRTLSGNHARQHCCLLGSFIEE